MSDPKCARVLIEAAERDLAALRGMMDEQVFADEVAGFHAQQAAEKLLKAWLALLGEQYPVTHNLAQLLDALQPHEFEAVGCRRVLGRPSLGDEVQLEWCGTSLSSQSLPACEAQGGVLA